MKKLLVLGMALVMGTLRAETTGSTGSASPTAIATAKPATTMTWMIFVADRNLPIAGGLTGVATDEAISGEVRLFATTDNYMTQNGTDWMPCDGRTLLISQYPWLFVYLGTTFGGNGTTTFNIPDLRGRIPIGAGTGTGLTARAVGQTGGGETTALTSSTLPAHSHTITGGNTDPTGGAAMNNMPPFLVLQPAIVGVGNSIESVGTIRWFAFSNPSYLPGFACDGSLKTISQNFNFFSKIGATFGGNGSSNFAVPDLRGRMAIGAGTGSGLTARTLGQSGGAETYQLAISDMPGHTHTYSGGTTGSTGGAGASHNIMPPFLVLNTGLASEGYFGQSDDLPAIGEVRFFAQSATLLANDGANTGLGWLPCNGTVQDYSNIVNSGNDLSTYFFVVSTTWGGDGNSTVGLPDLRGRSTVKNGQGSGLTNRLLGAYFGAESLPALTSANLPAHTHNIASTGTAVSSLNIANSSPTNASTVNWTLTFASATTGVTAGNFALAGTATSGASIGTPTTSNSGLTWNIPVTTGSGSGTLGLNFANATGLSQSVTTTLPFTGQTYTMDKVTSAPTLTLPVSSTSVGSPMSISYSLPEAATDGSVKLFFVGSSTVTVTLTNANGTIGAHSFTLDLNNLVPGTNVASSTATLLPNGTYTVALQYQDALGNAAAQASSTNVLVDTITQSPTLTAPATNGTSGNPISVNYTLPEQALSGSVKLAFGGGSTITVTLTNANGTSGSHSFTLDPTNVSGSPNVSATTSSTIPNGTYTVGLTYQDALGNAAAGAVATNFTVNVAVAPSISTPTTASVTSSSATLGGNVTSDGGSAITERGVVYAPTAANSDPVIGGSGVIKVTASGTTGVFTAGISGLSAATGYSFKAYATNIVGTTYTSAGTFTTLSNNANLSALTLNAGTLSPTFSANTTSYTAIVLKPTVNLVVTPTVAESHATVQVRANGGSYSSVISGAASGNLVLNLGSNTIDVLVTAQDSSITKTYSLAVTRWTYLEAWRDMYFHDISNTGDGADTAVPQNDGVPNLLKFATGLDPTVSGTQPGSVVLNGNTLEFTYPRSIKAASEVTFLVEWSDTLDSGSWSAAGVTESVLSDDGTLQQVKASVDATSQPRRFMRLRVTNP